MKKDVTLDGFEQAINEFAETARGADVALFYFAGHGFSIAEGGRQQNLLMATNADFSAKTAFALQSGGEPIEHVEETIIGHAHATLIFIDACRNVPMAMASRSIGTRGFAPMDASAFDGAFVVVSTREGKTAADGAEGQGSPFARAVAAVLPTPGMRIEDAYYRIRDTGARRHLRRASSRRHSQRPAGRRVGAGGGRRALIEIFRAGLFVAVSHPELVEG